MASTKRCRSTAVSEVGLPLSLASDRLAEHVIQLSYVVWGALGHPFQNKGVIGGQGQLRQLVAAPRALQSGPGPTGVSPPK